MMQDDDAAFTGAKDLYPVTILECISGYLRFQLK
jgi:hypothetical protein